MTRIACLTACLTAAFGACIPDNGSPRDAAVELPPFDLGRADLGPGADAEPADLGASDGASDAPDAVAACTTADYEFELTTLGTMYEPDAVTVPAGMCIRFCANGSASGGEVHTHTSDEGLFPAFNTGADRACALYVRPLTPGVYGITCTQHSATMKAKVTAQ